MQDGVEVEATLLSLDELRTNVAQRIRLAELARLVVHVLSELLYRIASLKQRNTSKRRGPYAALKMHRAWSPLNCLHRRLFDQRVERCSRAF